VRTDRRRARTRAALLQAGQTLFAARPVEAVSIDDIVAEAGVAKGSFYNHFADREALAHEVGLEVRRSVEVLAAQTSAGVADPAERIARALCGFSRQALADPVGMQAGLNLFQGASIPDAPTNAGVRADVREGLASGRFSGLALESGLLLTVGAVQIAVGRALTQKDPARVAGLCRDLAFGLLRGLGLEPQSAKAIATRAAADIFAGPPPAG
jgi:AcrR family transcriptional regulator